MKCEAITDGFRCSATEEIGEDGLCYYHHKLTLKGEYRYWNGRLMHPTKSVEFIVHNITGKRIYTKGVD